MKYLLSIFSINTNVNTISKVTKVTKYQNEIDTLKNVTLMQHLIINVTK